MFNIEMALAGVTYLLTVIVLLIVHAVKLRKSAKVIPERNSDQKV